MKRSLLKLLSLTLCAAMLCGSALALEVAGEERRPGPVGVWGTATRMESGSLYLENSDETVLHREIVVHISDETAVVDGVSGLPMDPAAIADGDTVYAWVGPAMTMSLPPQSTAAVVVANLPADAAAPQYHQVDKVQPQAMLAIYPPPALTYVDLVTAGGQELHITDQAALQPYRTKNVVRLEDLIPGTELLVWSDGAGAVRQVTVLPYAYRGYLTWDESGRVRVDGALLDVSGRTAERTMLLPLRAVAEAAGYDVTWDAAKGAVVSSGGAVVLSAMPGGAVLLGEEGNGIAGICVKDQGTTYLEAGILAMGLNLYPGA